MMKRKADILLGKSLHSLILSVDHYNRIDNTGRHEAVLIFLDRSFELLLKSIIIHKGGDIRDHRAKETYNFYRCVRKCISKSSLKCLTEDDALTIQTINSLRDAAQHHILDISEELLFIYLFSGFTLYRRLIKDIFKKNITQYIPQRVFPTTVFTLKDISNLIKDEYTEVKKLISPGKRKRIQARAKLRALAIIEESLSGIKSQPSEKELGWVVRRIKEGGKCAELFPRMNSLSLNFVKEGSDLSLTINKKKGEPVHLVPEGTPGSTIIAIKHRNELSYYSLDINNLASRLNLSLTQTKELIKHFNLKSSDEYFKEIRICSSLFERYSFKAFDFLKKKI